MTSVLTEKRKRRKAGRKEGRKEGKKGGGKERRRERKKEGRKERRKERTLENCTLHPLPPPTELSDKNSVQLFDFGLIISCYCKLVVLDLESTQGTDQCPLFRIEIKGSCHQEGENLGLHPLEVDPDLLLIPLPDPHPHQRKGVLSLCGSIR